MDVFFALFSNILPLYGIVALGWIARRFYDVDQESLASLAIYIVVPIVSFYYIATVEFKPVYAALPLVVFALHAGFTLLFYRIGKAVYPDTRANLLALCAGASNTGYFGLSLVILLFSPAWVGVYIFALIGGLLYEATVLYYIANRGSFSPQESVRRVLRFPVLYAVLLGGLVNFTGADLPALLDPYWGYFKGAYLVIGMMIIGCSLPKFSNLVIAPKFVALVFLAQFVLWPLAVLGVRALDLAFWPVFEPEIHKMLLIMAVVPPAANVTAYAARFNLRAEKAATTIFLGTLFALFYIPVVLWMAGFY